jgi:hypothetical protein
MTHFSRSSNLKRKPCCTQANYAKISATKLHYKISMSFLHQILQRFQTTPFLGWSAWMRIAAVVPLLALLWLAVWWASIEAAPL